MATTDLTVEIHPPFGEEPLQPALLRSAETINLWGPDPASAGTLVSRVRPGVFRETVDSGTYVVRAAPAPPPGALWTVPECRVRVQGKQQRLQLFMGQPDWPSYQIGYSLVPFRPPDTLAVVFETAPPSGEDAARLLAALRDEFKFEFPPEGLGAVRVGDRFLRPARGSILLMRGSLARHDPEAIEGFVVSFLKRRPTLASPRVGIAVDLRPGRVKVLDRRFILRHDGGRTLARTSAEEIGGRWVRDVDSAPGTILFELRGGDHERHLSLLEALRRNDQVVYVEPDLMSELEDASTPVFAHQFERIPEAWALLDQRRLPQSGSPNVRIAILDNYFDYDPERGTIDHSQAPDHQVIEFRDFYNGPDPGSSTSDPCHGLKVYGVVAARHDDLGAEGVAAGTSIFLAQRPSVASNSYNDILLWLCGLKDVVPGFSDASAPNPHPVDVICCAHISGCPTMQPFSDMMQRIVSDGRVVDGIPKGALVVYAAGNHNLDVSVDNGFADDPNTLAVANCVADTFAEQSDPEFITRSSLSNFGAAIDLCALGDQAYTLLCGGADGPFDGGGTSAACAAVAGAIGLLLTAFPDETHAEIRARLQSGAQLVDRGQTNPLGAWDRHNHSGYYGYGLLDLYASMQ